MMDKIAEIEKRQMTSGVVVDFTRVVTEALDNSFVTLPCSSNAVAL